MYFNYSEICFVALDMVPWLNSCLVLLFEGLTLYNFFYEVCKVLNFGR